MNDQDYWKQIGYGIVSSCPMCGAPIYGPERINPTVLETGIRYSCSCHYVALEQRRKSFEDTIGTK